MAGFQVTTEDDAKRALDAFERTQAALTNLTQQLRSIAGQIIGHTHDQTHCPLCGTQFDRSDLEARLRESIQSLADGESQRMRLQTQESELAHQRALAVLQALRTLSRYQAAVNDRTTVRSILTRVPARSFRCCWRVSIGAVQYAPPHRKWQSRI